MARGENEAEVLLAVFSTAAAAGGAQRALELVGIPSSQSPVLPGSNQGTSRASEGAGEGAAIVGAIVGALIGVGLAVWLFGSGLAAMIGLAVAGAFVGSRIGLLLGIRSVSRSRDTSASETPVQPGSTAIVIRVEAPANRRGEARDILLNAGAVGLLDVPAYEARLQEETGQPAA